MFTNEFIYVTEPQKGSGKKGGSEPQKKQEGQPKKKWTINVVNIFYNYYETVDTVVIFVWKYLLHFY